MRVLVKSLDRQGGRNRQGSPSLRALSASLLIHGTVVALLLSSSAASVTSVPRSQTVYTQFIAPEEKKIIWYRLQELPALTTPPDIVRSSATSGRIKNDDAIISRSTEKKPTTQIVIQTEAELPLEKKISAPNIVAVEADRQPPPAPKVFVPPSRRAELVRGPQVPAPPSIPAPQAPMDASILQRELGAQPRVTRQFILPPVDPSAAPAPKEVTVTSAPTLAGAGVASSKALSEIVERSAPSRITKPFVVPKASGGAGSSPRGVEIPETDSALGGAITAAILSTDPGKDLISAVPPGNIRGDMSQAPKLGAPTSNGTPGSSIPGLLIQPGNRTAKSETPPQSRIEYQETEIAAFRRTYSAPLRPSSRTIPRLIEARFHDRTVYSMIIPRPKLEVYGGDWVIWFAEHDPRPETSLQMRSPLPVRKTTPLTGVKRPLPGRAELAATISRSGLVDSVEWRGAGTPDRSAIDDLFSWQFLPALRDGVPIDVDVIIDISFR